MPLCRPFTPNLRVYKPLSIGLTALALALGLAFVLLSLFLPGPREIDAGDPIAKTRLGGFGECLSSGLTLPACLLRQRRQGRH